MKKTIDNAHTVLYADDTTILVSGVDFAEVSHKSQELLLQAGSWFCANMLALNRNKTDIMISSLRDLDAVYNTHAVRFLGIDLDPELTWGAHGETLAGILGSVCYGLRQLATEVSTGVLEAAYFALFHSRFSYAVLAWGHSAVRHRTFGLQRRAIRFVGGVGYRDGCKELFTKLKILTLPFEYALQCLIYVKRHREQYETQSNVHEYL